MVELPTFVPVFHNWIQQHTVAGELIDVADYKHVPEGPGIMLIGYEADYAINMGRGRMGLLYDQKRAWLATVADDDEAETIARIRLTLQRALLACQALEAAPSLTGRIAFDYDEVEIAFADRLRTPNQPAVTAALRGAVESGLADLFGDNMAVTALETDVRRSVAFLVKSANPRDLSALLGNLQTATFAGAA
ncbi:MAG: hypothetical protein HC802_13445 [Caldilineaceae bacterium]|nr:hypothetical protein [Caldilineaceae bacterium]